MHLAARSKTDRDLAEMLACWQCCERLRKLVKGINAIIDRWCDGVLLDGGDHRFEHVAIANRYALQADGTRDHLAKGEFGCAAGDDAYHR